VLDASPADRRALIETTEHGWWYSAPLPDATLVCTFQTDGRPGVRARWDAFLSAAQHTAARARGSTPARVRVVSANSHRLTPAAGDGWLAVGDAAAAHDPVSGLGILWALESGIRGAEAIVAGAVAGYVDDARDRFERYLATRARYYAMEDRWPDAPFWRRRRNERFDATMNR
jgi:flavin-dependent dehydrogenase